MRETCRGCDCAARAARGGPAQVCGLSIPDAACLQRTSAGVVTRMCGGSVCHRVQSPGRLAPSQWKERAAPPTRSEASTTVSQPCSAESNPGPCVPRVTTRAACCSLGALLWLWGHVITSWPRLSDHNACNHQRPRSAFIDRWRSRPFALTELAFDLGPAEKRALTLHSNKAPRRASARCRSNNRDPLYRLGLPNLLARIFAMAVVSHIQTAWLHIRARGSRGRRPCDFAPAGTPSAIGRIVAQWRMCGGSP